MNSHISDNEEYLMLSALQHYAFCPRQFALIHIEQVWAENRFTTEGNILHERVDSGNTEQRGEIRYERGVLLESQHYRIKGKMDLLEKAAPRAIRCFCGFAMINRPGLRFGIAGGHPVAGGGLTEKPKKRLAIQIV